jgi:hypothetical protein
VLKRGTPIAQCIPVRREPLEATFDVRDEAATQRSIKTLHRIRQARGVYRREYRR